MEWTSETIARLQELWQQGLSTAEIGRHLDITKNAVVGKAHRLGLPPRPSPIRAGSKPRKSPEAIKDAGSSPSLNDAVTSTVEAKPARRKVAASQESASKKTEMNTSAAAMESAPTPTAQKTNAVAAKAPRAADSDKVDAPQPVDQMASVKPQPPVKAPAPAKPLPMPKLHAEKELRPVLRPLTVDKVPRKGPSCCWPFGDPGTPEFRFCGAKPVAGKPYCAAHCAVAYVKLRDRREGSGGGSSN